MKHNKDDLKSGLAVYDHYVAFWGSAFSNFFPCEFTYDGKTWKSSEQCFMAMKAKYFGDMDIYERILASTEPKHAKSLGRLVKKYDDKEWCKVRYDYMYEIVKAKFSQNEYLKEFIKDELFKGKKFVEGSPFDGIYGVKMDYRNPDIDDEENWNGINLLGKILCDVRSSLLKE